MSKGLTNTLGFLRCFMLAMTDSDLLSEHSYSVLSPNRVDSGCFGVNSISCPDPFYPTVTCDPAPCQIVNVLINNPESGAWAGGGPMKYITYAMLKRINDAQQLLPGFEVRITYQDDGCNAVQSLDMLVQQLIDNPNFYVAFGGTSCSDTAMATARMLRLFRMPQICWACSSADLSDRENYPDFFRTRVSDMGSNLVWLKIMETVDWVKIGVVYGLTRRFKLQHTKLHEAIAAANELGQDIMVLYDEQVLILDVDTRRVVAQLIQWNSRVMIVLAYAKVLRAIMCHGLRRGVKGILIMTVGWHATNFVQDRSEPDMLGFGPSDFTCTLAEMNKVFMNAVIGTIGDLWSSHMGLNTSCVPEETPASLKYWFQNIGIGGTGYEADGTTYVDQISAGMDGMCTILLMLKEMLVIRKRTVAELQGRSDKIYREILNVFAATSFTGVSSRTVEFSNGDLIGGISILQTRAETPDEDVVWVPLGKYEQEQITFSEREIMWPDGSTGFSNALPENFQSCSSGLVLHLGDCLQCDAGKASVLTAGSIARTCVNCEAGKYIELQGQTACKWCPSGSKSFENESERQQCEYCIAGRFNSQLGALVCTECQAGRHGSNIGMVECDSCGPGYFSNRGALECRACDAGYYADLHGKVDGCAACLPGRYASSTGLSYCAECPVGSFINTIGRDKCEPCPGVRTTKEVAAQKISQCVCPAGMYEKDGHCRNCPLLYTSRAAGSDCEINQEVWVVILGGPALVLSFIIVVFSIRWKYKARMKIVIRGKLQAAIDTTNNFDFPMVLVSQGFLSTMSCLKSHEEIRREHPGALTFIDSLTEAEDLKYRGFEIIFVSHQWTSWHHPDPTAKQFEVMVHSIGEVALQLNSGEESPEKMFVWIDYVSVPQTHVATQTLAINSLCLYAFTCSAFIIVAPSIEHANTGLACDVESYKRRGWCSAEQLSCFWKQAGKNMWIAVGTPMLSSTSTRSRGGSRISSFEDYMYTQGLIIEKALSSQTASSGDLNKVEFDPTWSCSTESVNQDWLLQTIRVFHGSFSCCARYHIGMRCCDRERLVIPILGLFARFYRRRMDEEFAALRDLVDSSDDLFPKQYTLERQVNGNVVKETRPLFGNLIQEMKWFIDESPEAVRKTIRKSDYALSARESLETETSVDCNQSSDAVAADTNVTQHNTLASIGVKPVRVMSL